jgi:hypothetical protein
VYHPPPQKKSKKEGPNCGEGALESGTCWKIGLKRSSKLILSPHYYVNLVFEKIFGASPLPSPVFSGKILWFLEMGGGPNFLFHPPPPNHLAQPDTPYVIACEYM